MSYFLYGYNGLGNIGDDLMYLGLINSLPKNEPKYSSKKNYEMPGEIQCNGFELFFRIMLSNVFMIIGGNVFSYERPKSYLKITFFIITFLIRRLLSKKNVIDSVGLDLKEGRFWRLLVLMCLNFVDEISLRDKLSYRYARRYLKSKCIYFKFDRVFRESEFIRELSLEASKQECDHNEKLGCDIIWWVSSPAYKKSNMIDLLPCDISKYKEKCKGKGIVFFCQGIDDVNRAEDIAKFLSLEKYEIFNYNFKNLKFSLLYMKAAPLVITERYHGAILAEVYDTDWVSVPFTEKLNRVKPNLNKIDL